MADSELLQSYARDHSELAFRDLVARYIDLVYATALRVAGGDGHLAQDVTQSVFIHLARKAGSLPQNVVLAGWLHRHAWFTAANAVRTERRRRQREQIATELRATADNEEAPWEHIAAHLDESLDELPPDDRNAVVLRFLDRQDFRAIGATLGVSDDAAQKRVSRALDKLRSALDRRGAKISAVALASLLTAKSVTAAPAGLVATVSTASLAAATTVGAATVLTTTTKGVLMTKLQLTVTGLLLVAGASIPLAVQHQSISRLRAENQQLQTQSSDAGKLALEQADQLSSLKAENRRLSNMVGNAGQLTAVNQAAALELLDLRGQVTHLQALTNARPAAPPPGNSIADLMKRPGMKEILDQTYTQMIDKEYGPLIAQLQLSTNQAAAFKQILKDEMLAAADESEVLFSGDAAKIRDAAAATESKIAGPEEQVRQLLGDANFTQYRDYQKTLGSRLTLISIKDSLGDGVNALSSAQETQLLQALTEEQSRSLAELAARVNPAGTLDLTGTFDAMDRANQRIVARASNFLAPTQVEVLQTTLQSSAAAGRAMFNPNSANSSGR